MLVFLSHTAKDEALARLVHDTLAEAGIDVWIALKHVRRGSFVEQVDGKLEEANVFVLVWSEAARASRWVQVEWNAALAMHGKGLDITLVVLQTDDVPAPSLLSAFQHCDTRLPLWKQALINYCRGASADSAPNGRIHGQPRWTWARTAVVLALFVAAGMIASGFIGKSTAPTSNAANRDVSAQDAGYARPTAAPVSAPTDPRTEVTDATDRLRHAAVATAELVLAIVPLSISGPARLPERVALQVVIAPPLPGLLRAELVGSAGHPTPLQIEAGSSVTFDCEPGQAVAVVLRWPSRSATVCRAITGGRRVVEFASDVFDEAGASAGAFAAAAGMWSGTLGGSREPRVGLPTFLRVTEVQGLGLLELEIGSGPTAVSGVAVCRLMSTPDGPRLRSVPGVVGGVLVDLAATLMSDSALAINSRLTTFDDEPLAGVLRRRQ